MSALPSQAPTARSIRPRLAAWALLALALAACVAGVGANRSWFFPALVLLILAGHLLAASRRPSDGGLLGPLFFYEVVRLARRGRSTLLRCAYALALLGALCLAYSEQFPQAPLFDLSSVSGPDVPVRALPAFAQTVTLALLLAQGVAVLALTPAYVAGAVAEEKERRTLELLFTSHLSDREIVLGKLMARLAHLGGVFLAGTPVLCLTLLWGGVSAPALFAGFAAIGATLFSVGAVSALCSVLCRTTLEALVWSYVLVAFSLLTPFSPVAFVAILQAHLANSAAGLPMGGAGPLWGRMLTPLAWANLYVSLHLLIAWACAGLAVMQLRPVAWAERPTAHALPRLVPVSDAIDAPAGRLLGPEEPVPRLDPDGAAEPSDLPAAKAHPSRVAGACPPVGDWPLLWKEVYRAGPHAAELPSRELLRELLLPGCWLVGLGLLAPVGLGAVVAALDYGVSFREALNLLCRAFGIILAGGWCLGVAFAAARSVSRERDQGTLDSLLTLPVGRATLLGAKWLGSALRWRLLGMALLLPWAVGLTTGALHPLGVLLSALAFATCLALLASVGLWLSLASRNTLWATVSMAAALLFLFLVPWAVWMNHDFSPPDDVSWQPHFAAWGLNPLAAWWFLGWSWYEVPAPLGAGRDVELFAVQLRSVLAGLALQAGVAAVAWLLAWRRLRATSGR